MKHDLATKHRSAISPSRRAVLAGGAAALATGVLTASARAQAAVRVVVVGGGWGGISAARNLKTMMPTAEVTMVEPKDAFMSCPMSVHYIVGHRSAESLMQDFSALERIGVRHLKDTAETIDRAARVVVTASERLPYDFLVLSPGISYMESAIPGFAEHRDKLPVGLPRLRAAGGEGGARRLRGRRHRPVGAADAIPLPDRPL
jgi:sulfide dehydrogenase [flavocytochrome c] flavoprotein subunit